MHFAMYFNSCTVHLILKMLFFNSQRPSSTTLSPAEEEEEDGGENSCGPTGLWEALTPCNGCRNLGFPSLTQVIYPIPQLTIESCLNNVSFIVV